MRINFALDARDLWMQEYERLTAETSGNHAYATSRAEVQVKRLALIYALLDGDDKIRSIHLRAGLAVWKYCNDSARYIFGNPTADPVAVKVLEFLKDGEKTQTELRNSCAKKLDKKAFAKILKRLEAVNNISQRKVLTAGRPKIVWSLA